jgi:hypothetical protein
MLLIPKSFWAFVTTVFWNLKKYPTWPETVNEIYKRDKLKVVVYLNFYFYEISNYR